MKRLMIAAVSALVLVAVVPASSRGAQPRQVSYEYSGANSFQDPAGSVYASFGVFSTAAPRAGEHYVAVEIADASGRPVLAEVHQGNHVLGEPFCGASDRLRLVTRRAIHVHLMIGPGCDDVSFPTQGTVTAAFD